MSTCMKFPILFVNHGGGPLPLLGRQPELVENMKLILSNHMPPKDPKAIVMVSAHWESNPIKVTSSPNPSMYFDYYNFPPETYKYEYPAPGSPDLANKIKNLLEGNGLDCQLDDSRGYDHGVFVPLMIMYPQADIPVVCVSLHSSLDAEINMKIGTSLARLREEEEVLIIGSGYTFHNMKAFFNPSGSTVQASIDFNTWLKHTIMDDEAGGGDKDKRALVLERLKEWDKAPGARMAHPREEHLLPLLLSAAAAAAGDNYVPKLIHDTTETSKEGGELTQHAITGYIFE